MSTKYRHSHEEPTAVLARRLDELSDAIGRPGEERDRELTMRIPAEVDRDADLVLCEAARRLLEMDAELEALINRIHFLNRQNSAQQEQNAALAAHVERLFEVWDTLTSEDRTDVPTLIQHVDDVFADGPTTSLARLKAQWQAEVLYEFTHGSYVMPATLNLAMCKRADELRRQAEGGE